jgi:hypothetical protein
MARILVQTDDRQTVLDECNVQLPDIDDERSAAVLFNRLQRAVRAADRRRAKRSRPARLVAAIVPATDYRDVGA